MVTKAPSRRRSGAKPEALLLRSAMAWCQGHGILAWRMALGPVIHRNGTVWARNPLAGFPDVCGVLQKSQPGRLWAIEFKSPKGRLRATQKVWIERLQMAGCAVAVVRHVGELRTFFQALGELP